MKSVLVSRLRNTWAASIAMAAATSAMGSPALSQTIPDAAHDAIASFASVKDVQVIDIKPPSALGISTNVVTLRGNGELVIDNSATPVAISYGGSVRGNAKLKRSGPARTIVLEVIGSGPARLSGLVEIAGAPAQLIIVSSSGIAMSGATCFVGLPWTTLSTGRPLFGGDGALNGFGAASGNILVAGRSVHSYGSLDMRGKDIEIDHTDVTADQYLHIAADRDLTLNVGLVERADKDICDAISELRRKSGSS